MKSFSADCFLACAMTFHLIVTLASFKSQSWSFYVLKSFVIGENNENNFYLVIDYDAPISEGGSLYVEKYEAFKRLLQKYAKVPVSQGNVHNRLVIMAFLYQCVVRCMLFRRKLWLNFMMR